MNYVFGLLIGLGFSIGLFTGYLGARAVYRALIRRSSHRLILFTFVAGGGLSVVPVALFLAFFIGGNIGGGVGSFTSESLGLESIGAPIGIAAGIAIVLSAVVSLAALVSGCIGYFVSVALGGKLAA
jgi:hypothetical protein